MPSDWQACTLGDAITLKRGYDLPAKERRAGTVPIVSSSGFSGLHSEAMVKGPGVVTGRYGTIGQVFYVDRDFWPLNTTLYVQDFKGNDRRFVSYMLRTVDVHQFSDKAAVPGVNRNHLHTARIVLPPIREQVRIASLLKSLDDRIDLLRQTDATLESIAQALFKSWFIDFDPVRAKAEGREPEGVDAATVALFPDEFEESKLGLIPRGWQVLPFLQACDLIGGAQPPASTFIDEPREGYVRLLQIRDFASDAHVTYVPDTKKLKLADEDDILIGRYGSASGDKARDSLGRVCRGLSGAYNVALMKLSPIEIGGEFALQLVTAPSFYNYLRGVSAKAVQSGFSKSELGNLSVVVPPRILADIYEAIGIVTWQRIKASRAQARSLESLRDTILPRLISGQLRLRECQEQVEEAIA